MIMDLIIHKKSRNNGVVSEILFIRHLLSYLSNNIVIM